MTRFDPPADEVLSPIECVAVVARLFWNASSGKESWSSLTNRADAGEDDAMAHQAQYMRGARDFVTTLQRRAAGITHQNPLSDAERQRSAEAALYRLKPDAPLLSASDRKRILNEFADLSPDRFDANQYSAVRAYASAMGRVRKAVTSLDEYTNPSIALAQAAYHALHDPSKHG